MRDDEDSVKFRDIFCTIFHTAQSCRSIKHYYFFTFPHTYINSTRVITFVRAKPLAGVGFGWEDENIFRTEGLNYVQRDIIVLGD